MLACKQNWRGAEPNTNELRVETGAVPKKVLLSRTEVASVGDLLAFWT